LLRSPIATLQPDPREKVFSRKHVAVGNVDDRLAVLSGAAVPMLYNDPEHWRKRAEDARALARLMSDPIGKEAMMEIADKYDRLAARAVERLAQGAQGPTKPAA
jgi:hypothetical protein